MSTSVIDFDPSTNKLTVACPPWLIDKCRAIPNRRWSKPKRAWIAPVIMRNVEYLQKAFADATWTDGALRAVAELQGARQIRRLGFPAWYKFKRPPKKKQLEALDKAYGLSEFGFLMEPGTGKTQTAIDLSTCYAMEGRINAVLVVVPNSVTYNWLDELEKVCPIEYAADVMDTGSYRRAEAMIAKTGVFKWLICSWESLSQGNAVKYAERFVRGSQCMILADESSWAKNPKSRRTEAITELGKLAAARVIMTGTPVLSKLHDLYSQVEFLNTNIIGIGDFWSFRNRYVVMGGYENQHGNPTQVIGYQNIDELMELIGPYVFVAKKRECSDLPPKTPETSPPGILRRVELTTEQQRLYKQVRSKFAEPEFRGRAIPLQNTLEVMLRARQVVQGIISTDTGEKDKTGKAILQQDYIITPERNPKILELLRIFEESGDNQQAVIWSPFALDVRAATEALGAVYGRELVANLPKGDPKALQQLTREFRTGKYRFIVCSQQQGGIGIDNLQVAEIGVFLANTENLEWRLQAEGRLERGGATRPMTFYDIVADGTIDTKSIIPSLVEKRDLADFVQDRLQGKISRLEDLL